MLTNRYELPIASKDFAAIQTSFLGMLQTAYGGTIDEVTLHELLSFQIDMVAMVGDAFFRQVERQVKESSIATAVEPQTILDIALFEYGYVPSSAIAAKYSLTCTVSSAVGFIMPKGTVFQTVPTDGSTPVFFETLEDYVKAVGVSSFVIEVQHGATSRQTATSSGLAGQTILIGSSLVAHESVRLWVDGVEWSRVDTFGASLPDDTHFRVIVTELVPGDRRLWVVTGDGALGLVPPNGASLVIEYLAGGGTVGNVSLGTISRLTTRLTSSGGATVTIVPSNTAQTQRGQEPEPIDVTRIKAPRMLALHGGVVSLEDYASAALLQGAVRAVAYSRTELPALNPNTVAVYIAIDLTSPPSTAECTTIRDDILDTYRSNGTAKLSVVPMSFTDFTLDVDVYAADGQDRAALTTTVGTTIAAYFSLASVIGPIPHYVIDIGQPVYLSNFVAALESIEGVDHVILPNTTGAFAALEPEPNELARVTVALQVL